MCAHRDCRRSHFLARPGGAPLRRGRGRRATIFRPPRPPRRQYRAGKIIFHSGEARQRGLCVCWGNHWRHLSATRLDIREANWAGDLSSAVCFCVSCAVCSVQSAVSNVQSLVGSLVALRWRRVAPVARKRNDN